MKFRTIAAVALLLIPVVCGAQSKSETKQYNRALSKGTVAAYDKFLSKYPASVYAASILGKKDTLLNVTPFSDADALLALESLGTDGLDCKAFAYRSEGVDRAVAFGISPDTLKLSGVRVYSLLHDAGSWKLENRVDYSVDGFEGFVPRSFADSSSLFTLAGRKVCAFNVACDGVCPGSAAYVACVYDIPDQTLNSLSFHGKTVQGQKIEGRSNEALCDMGTPAMQYAKSVLDSNPSLVRISEGDLITDDAIAWWLSRNPDALTSARRVVFGALPPESSLVATYLASKGKKNGQRYKAAMFDIRGYTVIVAYQKQSESYVLVWAEKECADHWRDRLLNEIYFEQGNTLAMFYYHGKKTFKYHINLSDKSLRRS